MLKTKLGFLLAVFFLLGCRQPAPEAVPVVSIAPPPTTAALPPTFTRPAPAVPPATRTPRLTPTTAVTATAIDFDKTAVELRYMIPAIGLDRRLRGNISGQIFLVDETTGQTRQYNNQSNTLIDLQQALPGLTLEPVEACDSCVQIAFNLPLAGESGQGWLQDTTLLVSVENYMAAALGPHFPPGTRLGLRRSISLFAPAHTLAVTEDGRLWRWLAADARIPDPVDVATAAPGLLPLLDALPLDALAAEYAVNCDGTPVETLLVNPDTPPIQIACPEFALPNTLLPLYLALDSLLAPVIADAAAPRPPSPFPLDALLDYRRADNAQLTIFQDGRVVALNAAATVTGTLSSSQINSLTTDLLASGQLQLGLTSFKPTATPAVTATIEEAPPAVSRLLLRGPQGVYDGQWPGIPDLPELNALLDSFLPPREAVPVPLGTAVSPEPTAAATANP